MGNYFRQTQMTNEKDLETLSKFLLEEGKNRMPVHQSRIELLTARKAGNEKTSDWIERVHSLLKVAKVETMTLNEIGIHIFMESVDTNMTKLALEALADEKPNCQSTEH